MIARMWRGWVATVRAGSDISRAVFFPDDFLVGREETASHYTVARAPPAPNRRRSQAIRAARASRDTAASGTAASKPW